jgi:starch synthase (maltosyl-transferring)
MPLWEFGLPDQASIEVEEPVNGAVFTWTGKVQPMCARPNQPALCDLASDPPKEGEWGRCDDGSLDSLERSGR